MASSLNSRFHATYVPNDSTSSADAIEIQQLNDRDSEVCLGTIVRRCELLGCSAHLRNAGGLPRGRVYADGAFSLDDNGNPYRIDATV